MKLSRALAEWIMFALAVIAILLIGLRAVDTVSRHVDAQIRANQAAVAQTQEGGEKQ